MRVLFFGGTSFTGPYAVRELVSLGHDVTVVHRGRHEGNLPDDVRHVHADVAALGEAWPELLRVEPDVVVDMLAFTEADAGRVLAFAGVARWGVVISSSDVYRAYGRLRRTEPGPPDPVPLTEDSPLRSRVVEEGYDKVEVERAVTAAAELPVTILRYPAVYGPGDPQHRLYGYVRRMLDGRHAIPVQEDLAGWRWVRGYVEDAGHALALAAVSEHSAGSIFNVAEQTALDERAWILRIAEVLGWNGRVIPVPRLQMPDTLREELDFGQDYVVDSRKIRKALGYAEAVDSFTALERTVAWERDNPPADFELDYDAEDRVLASLG